jgi:hypothetical protein
MTANELLTKLREQGIEVRTSGDDNIIIDAPVGMMTGDLRSAIASHKLELLQILKEESESRLDPGVMEAPNAGVGLAAEMKSEPVSVEDVTQQTRVIRKMSPAMKAEKPGAPGGRTAPLAQIDAQSDLAPSSAEVKGPPTAVATPPQPPTRQVRVLRPTAAALNAGIKTDEHVPANQPDPASLVDAPSKSNEKLIEVDSGALEAHWNRMRPPEDPSNPMRASKSKVRLYDLAKELKIDTKRLIEEVRREGVDVSVPSNSISPELARIIRVKYSPKKDTVAKRTVRIVRKAGQSMSEDAGMNEQPNPAVTEESVEKSSDKTEEKNKTLGQELLPLEIAAKDEVLLMVRNLITDYAGVILTGPPGTSKTWYARQIAAALADRDPKHVRFVQFHQSYQYEDFIEG